jgi:hypothetical protein
MFEDPAGCGDRQPADLDERADERQSSLMPFLVACLVAAGRLARGQESLADVVLDRRYRHAGDAAELADPHGPILACGPASMDSG